MPTQPHVEDHETVILRSDRPLYVLFTGSKDRRLVYQLTLTFNDEHQLVLRIRDYLAFLAHAERAGPETEALPPAGDDISFAKLQEATESGQKLSLRFYEDETARGERRGPVVCWIQCSHDGDGNDAKICLSPEGSTQFGHWPPPPPIIASA